MWHRQQDGRDSYSPAEPILQAGPAEPPAAGLQREAHRNVSRIGEGLGIRGEIQGDGDLRIGGSFEGSARLTEAAVAIGPHGRVRDDIQAPESLLEGRVRGNLLGDERVRIAATGVLLGDAAAPRLTIEEGAVIRGRVEVTAREEASASSDSAFAAPAGAPAPLLPQTRGSSE